MSITVIHQVIAFLFSVVAVYYSFRDLNASSKSTSAFVRVPLIASFGASLAVLTHIMLGGVPHWSFTFLIAALALKLGGERRRERPFASPGIQRYHKP